MTTHFARRCRERGITETDLEQLFSDIVENVVRFAKGQYQDVLERVLVTHKARFFRFKVPEGIFYAVVPLGMPLPMTVYDQKMMRDAKRAHKRYGRQHKRALHKPAPEPRPVRRRETGKNWRDLVK